MTARRDAAATGDAAGAARSEAGNAPESLPRGVRIHVTGVVQGVGMRPFVYREAAAHGISGWVLNAGDGVHVEAWGSCADLDAFVAALSDEAPAAARVERVAVTPIHSGDGIAAGAAAGTAAGATAPVAPQGFHIVASEDDTAHTTLVSPDIATCPDCVRELFDPADRRFHYPFINCTNCGPRFTIIRDLPYDRSKTSMSAFPMCPDCAREYADPLDRRFHAQPDACFACGPHLTLMQKGTDAPHIMTGETREKSDAIIDACAGMLASGRILAIKGLGGFHLACDAGDEAAVRELRRRKRRSNKPLAVMMRALDDVRETCLVDDTEAGLLTGSVRPIVLLRRRSGTKVPRSFVPLAFGLPELGVMLPYTPLQHLLMAACEARGMRALVMTSGNLSEEPIETDDGLAWKHLVESGIADALLGNDRAILSRYDDSVVRVVAGEPMPVRRARGYAPMPLELPSVPNVGIESAQSAGSADLPDKPAKTLPCILACGSEQKATIALTRENPNGSAACFLSQHIGDVENGGTFRAWHEARERMEGLFDLHPEAIACDLHPSYLPSQWGREAAREHGLPLVEVQHHHAHIASVMAEHGETGAVVGIALDGTGAGTDGSVWGGEILVADLTGYERAAHLATWRLPGGAASVRDARRNAFSLLSVFDLLDHPGAAQLLAGIDDATRRVTATMIERGLNSPLTSSMGRLLDAIAALTGICDRASYEGEPAIQLEASARRALESGMRPDGTTAGGYRLGMTREHVRARDLDDHARAAMGRVGERLPAGGSHLILDPLPLLKTVLDDLSAGTFPQLIALRVHEGVAADISEAAAGIAFDRGIRKVALSGGVFMNRLLLERIRELLELRGLAVLVPHAVPVNDGCIAYGQASIARVRLA